MIRVVDGTPVKLEANPESWDPKRYHSIFHRLTRDDSNIPLVHFSIRCFLWMTSLAFLVFYFNSHWMGVTYIVLGYMQMFPRFMCFFHPYTHWRPLTYLRWTESLLVDGVLSLS